jgi:hypothetical protein
MVALQLLDGSNTERLTQQRMVPLAALTQRAVPLTATHGLGRQRTSRHGVGQPDIPGARTPVTSPGSTVIDAWLRPGSVAREYGMSTNRMAG